MTPEFRDAEPSDAEDVVRVLYGSRLRFIPYAPPAHSRDEMLAWVERHLIPSGGATVAMVDRRIVGVLAVAHQERYSWIDHLYIEPGYCGCGIGTRMLKLALATLRRPIRLYTFQKNHRARQFYECFGFVPIKFSDGLANEESCPDVLYELA